jgi:hypothetical protein
MMMYTWARAQRRNEIRREPLEDKQHTDSFPVQTIHFLKSIKTPRWEDYDYTYRYKNRFAFLGNGDVKATASKDVLGLSPYIRNSDHEWDVE